ncbi:MAG: hypothetical protein ACT4PL_07500 [Phycisphaerales bacterium]
MWIAHLFAVLLLCTQALADQPISMRVDWGYGANLTAERWSPVWITLSTSPGTPAVNGTVVIEYTQDASQNARIVQQVATTPGRATVLCMAVCVPQHCGEIDVSFFPDRGLRPISQRFRQGVVDPEREQPMPLLLESDGLHVGVIGSGLGVDEPAFLRWTPSERRIRRDSYLSIHPVAQGFIPTLPAALEALDLLIVRAEAARTMEPRSLAAIRQWVNGGGRLIILANQPGDAWRLWLSANPSAPSFIDVEGEAFGPLSQTAEAEIALRLPIMRDHLASLASADGVETALPIAVPGSAASALQPKPASPSVALIGPRRPITVTPAGRAAGWKTRWPLSDALPNAPAGLIAEGPLGLGAVTVLGALPSALSPEVTAATSAAGWESAVATLLKDRVPLSPDQYGWRSYSATSGATEAHRVAIEALMDRFSAAPPLPFGVFILIGAAAFALVLMVGPFDYIALGRLRHSRGGLRHISHVTAVIWIALAAAASYGLPRLIRTSDTIVERVSGIDAVLEAPDGGTLASAPWAACSSITSIWSGGSDSASFARTTGPGPADGAWRGVSPVALYGFDRESALPRPTNTFLLRPAQVASDDPSTGGFTAAADGAVHPTQRAGLDLRSWTLRALVDDTRAPLPISVRLSPAGAGYSVEVRGLPEGCKPGTFALQDARRWWRVDGTLQNGVFVGRAMPDEPPPIVTASEADIGVAQRAFQLPAIDKNAPYSPYADHTRLGRSQVGASALALPGAGQRALAQRLRVESGRFVLLYMVIDSFPSDTTLAGPSRSALSRTVVLRLAVPVAPSDQAPPPPTPDEPQ